VGGDQVTERRSLAKSYCDDLNETVAPGNGGSFAEYAMISLHGLRIFLDETYDMTTDRLKLMPILELGGLEPAGLPRRSTLHK
jgi:hypothetical protein